MRITSALRSHKLATLTATAALAVASFGMSTAPAGATGITMGRAGLNSANCYQSTHTPWFSFAVVSNIKLGFHDGSSQEFWIWMETSYRANNSSAWGAWRGAWKGPFYIQNNVSNPIGFWGQTTLAGQQRHRYLYYWKHYTANGQVWWAYSDFWQYPFTYAESGLYPYNDFPTYSDFYSWPSDVCLV